MKTGKISAKQGSNSREISMELPETVEDLQVFGLSKAEIDYCAMKGWVLLVQPVIRQNADAEKCPDEKLAELIKAARPSGIRGGAKDAKIAELASLSMLPAATFSRLSGEQLDAALNAARENVKKKK